MFDNHKYTLLTFLYVCFSLSVMGQEKTDVEIHVGSKYDIYIDNSTTARHASGGVLSMETCEVGWAWQFSEKTDFEVSLRYQDGVVFAFDVKFGKMY